MNATFVVDDRTDTVFSEDSLIVGDSTRSLLTPLYASDYESHSDSSIKDNIEDDESTLHSSHHHFPLNKRYTKTLKVPPERQRARKASRQREYAGRKECFETKAFQHPKVFTKSWEEWLIDKALIDLKNIQIQKELKQKQKLETKREMEEKKEKDKKVEENRIKWLSQKSYEYEKQKKEKAAQKEYEKLKKQQQQEIISNKAKKAYDDWMKKKEEDKIEIKKKEQQQKYELQQKQIERKELNKTAYREWKQKLKQQQKECQTRTKSSTDDPLDYYEKLIGPSPTYVNPMPWNGVIEHQSNQRLFVARKGDRAFQSPPLLWKDHEERLQLKSAKRKTINKYGNKKCDLYTCF